MSKADELDHISNLIVAWIAKIRLNNAFSYTDINKIAEGFSAKLLNLIYGYQLKDLNKEKRDFPALDLGEYSETPIGFQITSISKPEKINKTLRKAISKDLHHRFHGGIKFLILNDREIVFGAKTNPALILGTFNKDTDILYPKDLIAAIETIYDDDKFDQFKKIKELIYREINPLASLIPSEISSELKVLREAVLKITSSPPNIPKYLTNTVNPSARLVIGREKALTKLDEILTGFDSCLLVNAYGGMGKSTLINKYVHSRAESFNRILYIELKIDFEVQRLTEQRALDLLYEAFVFEPVLQRNLGLDLDGLKLGDAFMMIINKLANIDSFNNLLVIDNVPFAIQRIKKYLPPSGRWKVLAASRKKMADWKPFNLPPLTLTHAKNLFKLHYGPTADHAALREIIAYLQHHTFAIILFASSARQNGWALPVLLQKLGQLNQHDEALPPVETSYSYEPLNAIQHLVNLFLVDELAMMQQDMSIKAGISQILLYFSVLPSVALDYTLLFKWSRMHTEISEREFIYMLNRLADSGWLTRITDESRTSFICHSVVQLAIQAQLKPDSNNCQGLIKSLIEATDVKEFEGEHGYFKKELLTYAESVFNAIYRGTENLVPEDKYLANLGDNIGWIAIDMGDPAKSLYYRSKDVAIKEKVLDPDDEHLGSSYSNLGLVYRHLEEYDKSIDLYDKCILMFTSTGRYIHKELANAYGNKSYVYLRLKKFDLMLEFILNSHQIRLKLFDEDSLPLAQSFHNVGECYRMVKNYPEALTNLLKAKDMREAKLKLAEPMHPDLATSYNNLALLHRDMGDLETAKTYIADALIIREYLYDDKHPYLIACRASYKEIWGL